MVCRVLCWLLFFQLCFCGTANAQASPAAPVVIELFSSQACAFCPQADRLFADLARAPNVIGLACHVDYYDVRRGALSHDFCTARQTKYEQRLHAGPNYTPQLVVQGRAEMTGYKVEAISAAMQAAAAAPIAPLTIRKASAPAGAYTVNGPPDWFASRKANVLTLLVYDRPHEVTIAGGANRGQHMVYEHIVSGLKTLGPWPAMAAFNVTPGLTPAQEGFAVLLQDEATGAVTAAGKYETP